MEWISVDKKLPEIADEYLVCEEGDIENERSVHTLFYNIKDGEWESTIEGNVLSYEPDIIAWQPLPKPPTADNTKEITE